MEKSSRRFRRQIGETTSSDMATGRLLGEMGVVAETHCPVLVSPGLLSVNKPPLPLPPAQGAAGGALVPGDAGAPGAASTSSLGARSCQGICSERGKGSAFPPRIPVPCHSFHPQGRIHPRGRVALSSPVPAPIGNKTKTPSYPTGNGDWRLFPVLFGTHETN